jgi:hypothetical protein
LRTDATFEEFATATFVVAGDLFGADSSEQKAIISEEIKEIESKSLENLPYGIGGMRYQWVDLDGEEPVLEQ